MGLRSGSKTKHNPKLNRDFLNAMTWETARAFTADTIPEDGQRPSEPQIAFRKSERW